MKHLTCKTLLFIVMAFSFVRASGQQAKAFEKVMFTAKTGTGKLLRLAYADGYIGASEITLKVRQRPAQLFVPVSGVPEPNGDLLFRPRSGGPKTGIILHGISDENAAPEIIKGIYNDGKVRWTLTFQRSGT
ncbi:hypothetical protein LJ707_09320 [Mucilaginibacter sp. UR6-1]|uniref:hypothetical protein n=1 Tax=Mucilaginibacter sp. UR6-1 TaxID=1435643 RepID=UPI001E64DAAF|nr:hypothetical protein [Mucilaginibacter sp. UR6-1]MCC8409130.1 hypothetical protein [Mucilaginibacter sp. UR6-1]